MAEVGQQNSMKVELAIQRELEYRRKVASLFQSDECIKDLMPLQVVSSVSCLSPGPGLGSWPGPRSNPNLAPSSAHQFTPLNAPGFCPGPSQIPNRPFQPSVFRPSAVPNHYPNPGQRPRPHPNHQPSYSGIKRKAASGFQQHAPHKPKLPQENYIAIDSSGNMFCKLCEVPCTGPFCLKQHLKGHKHKAKLQLLRKNGGEQEKKHQPKCDLCQIWCPHEDALKMHYQGQKHKARLQALEAGQKVGDKATERPWCGLCEIWCMNEDGFNQHLKGQKHLTRLYSMQEKERAMKASCR